MAGEKARLAFVGLGRWGGALAEAAARSGAVEILRGFARTAAARASFAEKFGARPAESLEEILRDGDVEGVVIATPHATHLDLIRQAASAGKHVFVDKPLTLTVEDARRAIAAAEAAGAVLQVGHHRRRLGATRRIREMIVRGELGQVHQLEAHVFNANRQEPAAGWQNDPAQWPAGGMTGRGVHMVDNFHYLAGPVKRVFAFSKKLLGATRLDDVTTIGLEFESGPLGYIGVSQVIPLSITTAVFGTEASAWSEADGARLHFQRKGEKARSEILVEAGDPLAEQLAEFARCIREVDVGGGDVGPETGGAEGLEVVAVLQAVIESARRGEAVEVSEFRG
ncbi:MAG: Gfo/Idh/MocA family oxidoreductase, partial [bacterium]